MNEVYKEFQSIDLSLVDNVFFAIQLNGTGSHFLAKNKSGSPLFIIKQSNSSLYQPDVKFRYFNVFYNVKCKVVVKDNITIDGSFCLIDFDDDSSELFEIFIRCVSASLSGFTQELRVSEINTYIAQLVELFRLINKPSENEIYGLWGELFFIKSSNDIEKALIAWHQNKNSRFDFELEGRRYEVKSTMGESRVHDFSLGQLNNDVKDEVLIISFLLKNKTNGTTILDLANNIEGSVKDIALTEKLWKQIIEIMGSDLTLSTDIGFDESYAQANMGVYSAVDIHKPIVSSPYVTSVRFRSDLSGLNALRINKLDFF